MSFKTWLDVMNEKWPHPWRCWDEECQLQRIEYTITIPLPQFKDVFRQGITLYSSSFPLPGNIKARFAVSKFPDSEAREFAVLLKIFPGSPYIYLGDCHTSLCHCLQRVECSFDFENNCKLFVLAKHDETPGTEGLYFHYPNNYPGDLDTDDDYETEEEVDDDDADTDPESILCRVVFVYNPSYLNRSIARNATNLFRQQISTVPKSFLENLNHILISSDGADVILKFAATEEIVRAHKAILMAHSEVFKAMFTTPMKESETGQVVISDHSKEEFQIFLQYLYISQLSAEETVGTYLALLRAAHKYAVPSLTRCVAQLLSTRLNGENVVHLLVQADVYGGSKLVESCITYIVKHSKELVAKALFATKDRPEVSQKVVNAFVGLEEMSVKFGHCTATLYNQEILEKYAVQRNMKVFK